MTPQQIRAAIAASTPALAMAHAEPPDTFGIAALLSGATTEVHSRITTSRGVAELYPGGPLAAEAVMLKLEGTRDVMLASADPGTKLMGSMLRRQLAFLASDGLDFGSQALRGMLDQFAAAGVITAQEAAGLKAIAERPVQVDEFAVRCAIFADDGALLV